MKKINRRDYLKGLGAGAAVLVGGANLSLLAQKRSTKVETKDQYVKSVGSKEARNKTEGPLIWQKQIPKFPTISDDYVVKLIFYGLMGFSSRGADPNYSCDVGIHRHGDSTHHHWLSIHAYEQIMGGECRKVYPCPPKPLPCPSTTEATEKISKLDLYISEPDEEVKQVYFYQPGTIASRDDLVDPQDFRWIIDFDSDYLYGKDFGNATTPKVRKKSKAYAPKFNVTSGVFYTLRKTSSTFRAQSAKGDFVSDLSNVADVLAANIYLKPSGSVRLTINDMPYTIHPPAEIYFINECFQDKKRKYYCHAEPHNIKEKKKRNDFYLNYENFELDDKPEFELFLLHGGTQTDAKVACARNLLRSHESSAHNPLKSDEYIFFTDEAPCAAAGYGAGGGLPPT